MKLKCLYNTRNRILEQNREQSRGQNGTSNVHCARIPRTNVPRDSNSNNKHDHVCHYGNSRSILHPRCFGVPTRDSYYIYTVVLYNSESCVVVGGHMGWYRSSCCAGICDDG